MAEPSELHITLCLSAKPGHAQEWPQTVPAGCSVQHACQLASQHLHWPLSAQDMAQVQPAVWGKRVLWTAQLRAGDRLELCRPLQVDPKVARRQRFAKQGAGRTGLFAHKRPGAAAGY